MNWPNRLTLLRILLVPVFLIFLLCVSIPHHFLWAAAAFGLASITDFLDGYLARKNNQVTTFGKFLDPLADKILVASALICMIELHLVPAMAVVVIIFREFMVTSIRLVASGSGKVIAANIWGKVKTVTQLIAILGILLMQEALVLGILPVGFPVIFIGDLLIWITTAATVISGLQYLVSNWDSVNTTK